MKFCLKTKPSLSCGTALVEYVCLMGAISAVAVLSIGYFSKEVKTSLGHSADALASAGGPSVEPNEPEPPGAGEGSSIGPFSFGTTWVNRWDSRARVSSDYVDIPGLEGDPYDFFLASDTGGAPRAVNHVVGGGEAQSGQLVWGTRLEAEPPGLGEVRKVRLVIGDQVGEWTIEREAGPVVQPFSFPDTIVAWNDSRTRIESDYVDITGLEGTPLPFTVSSSDGAGNPLVVNHVEGGGEAAAGEVTYGTKMAVDLPQPGQSRKMTLVVDDVSGTWVVGREAVPDPGPFSLTNQNGMSFAQISFSSLGIPKKPYSFKLSGTGNSAPYAGAVSSGTPTNGMTPSWGLNIYNIIPPSGVSETITLEIDGNALSWTVTGP